MPVVANQRAQRKEQTRKKILAALVDSLVEVGYAKTSTVAVQERAGISRGALLHHFPTRADLFEAAIRYVVTQNERDAREALERSPQGLDPVARAMQALAAGLGGASYTAEIELWAAARTDPELRAVLRKAERAARQDLQRVVDLAFGAEAASSPRYPLITELTVVMLRGLALTRALRTDPSRQAALIAAWSQLATQLLLPKGPR